MIDIVKAKELAQKEVPDYQINKAVDIGDRFVFFYDTGEPPIPGAPIVTISKQKGEVGYITIPPIENIDIIEAGKVIEEI